MKNSLRMIALLLCLVMLLSACGSRNETPEPPDPSAAHQSAEGGENAPAAETPSPTDACPVTEEPEPYTEPPVSEAVSVRMTRKDYDDREKVLIEGLDADGNVVWETCAVTEYRTELTLIEEIGLWQDRWYFTLDGGVGCLRLSDGSLLWTNQDFGGASISSLIDERNGNVYLCGWYGPDFFACDKDGKTLNRTGTVVGGFFWPSGMIRYGENELMIYYHGGFDDPDRALPFVVDLADYSFSWQFGYRELDASSQYWANVFVSDFAEQHMTMYPRDNGSDYELASFAHMFCKINRHEAIRYDGNCDSFSLDTVNELCMRFFGREIYPSDGVLFVDTWGHEYKFENGMFYFPAADGESYNRFAVVREYLELPSSAQLSFYVFELNLDEYWSKGMDDALYRLTAAEAEAMAATGRITRVGYGQAEVLPIEQNGHDGYHLYRLRIDLY